MPVKNRSSEDTAASFQRLIDRRLRWERTRQPRIIKTIAVKVFPKTEREEVWIDVPWGFGADYVRLAKDDVEDGPHAVEAVIDMMLLIGYEPKREAVRTWTLRKRVEAVAYAGNVYLRASDNHYRKHPVPKWLPMQPWKGPNGGPTVLSV